jgi:hypothetical protein
MKRQLLFGLAFVSMTLICLVNTSLAADPSLIGHWPLDGDTLDYSGNDRHGTIVGTETYVAGMIGQGLQLDGSSHVDCGNLDAYNVGENITMAVWFNVPGFTKTWETILSKGDNSFRFGTNNSGGPHFGMNGPSGGWFNGAITIDDGEWHHAACTYDGAMASIYIDGALDTEAAKTGAFGGDGVHPFFIGENAQATGRQLGGIVDDVMLYNRALSLGEVQKIMKGLSDPSAAKNPDPASEATDVVREVVLDWDAGETTVKRNVYFGTSYEDVNDASAGALASQNLTATSLDVGTLAFDQTYYWRVDEANGAPDNTVFPGEVWSFTVEPKGIPVTNITATASGAEQNMGPENTINGSGLTDDQHDTDPMNMWLTAGADTWIQYDFDTLYKLHELLIWNSNQAIEAFIGFGVKEMTVEYTADGETWSALDAAVELTRAPGLSTYNTPDAIDMGGAMAQAIRLSVISGQGFTPQVGLAEVRILAIPVMAREPQPADSGTSDGVEVELSWRAGREAVSHEVSLGADADSLVSIGTANEATLVTDALDYNTSYAWSVNEVNDAAVPASHAGSVWTFNTPEYGTVDDFESYASDEGTEVYMTWFDGFGGDAALGGSTTGHIDSPFVETSIVNSGGKSMPVVIDNDGGFFDIDGKSSSPNFSEVVRDLSPAQDWTASGVKTLSIMFAGSAGLTGQLYCKIGSSKIVYDGDASSIGSPAWQAWNIDLSTVGGNLKSVKEVAIGVDGGTSGILYLDDIRLYTQIGELITPAEPTADGLIAHYTFENNANDVSGNGHNGTLNGGALFATGKIGSALDCDGIDGYVSTDKSAAQLGIDGNNARTVSSWVYTRAYNNGGIYDVGARTATQDFCLRTMATENEWRIQYWGGDSDFNYDTVNKWVHFTHTHDGERTKVYADGMLIVDWEKTVDTSNENPFQIGCYGWQNDYFNGLIDEVRVYNRALTAEEALWLAGKTQPVHKPF